jgi:hypothetical protein
VRKWLKTQPDNALYGGGSYNCPLAACLTETYGKRAYVGFHGFNFFGEDWQEMSRGAVAFAARVTYTVADRGGEQLTKEQVQAILEEVWK